MSTKRIYMDFPCIKLLTFEDSLQAKKHVKVEGLAPRPSQLWTHPTPQEQAWVLSRKAARVKRVPWDWSLWPHFMALVTASGRLRSASSLPRHELNTNTVKKIWNQRQVVCESTNWRNPRTPNQSSDSSQSNLFQESSFAKLSWFLKSVLPSPRPFELDPHPWHASTWKGIRFRRRAGCLCRTA